jgi:hypothetical protein
MTVPRFDFYYRRNQNGTTDSICTNCFCTVVTARHLYQIRACEETHECSPKAHVPRPGNRRDEHYAVYR